MLEFKCQGAVARCRPYPQSRRGVWEAFYTGPLNQRSYDNLRMRVIAATTETTAMVIHMDRALMVMGAAPQPPSDVYRPCAAPAAMVVRADQYAMWDDYRIALAALGVSRGVFLTERASMAYQWAECLAAVRLRRAAIEAPAAGRTLPALQPHRPASGRPGSSSG